MLRALVAAGRGIAAAHRAGVVHGDVKPDNLLVGADGRVRVSDFGLALVARAEAPTISTPAGTPGYVAPEVAAGGTADARSDQWVLALTTHRALLGDPPRALAATPAQPMGQPAGGWLPAGVARALRRALAVDPRGRFTDVDSFVRALEGAAARRQRAGAGAALAIVGALVIGLAARGGPRGFATRCGNGVVDRGEDCDDDNTTAGDGCDHCLRCRAGALATLGGACYTLHTEPTDWRQAAATCDAQGEILATFPHWSSLRAVARALQASRESKDEPVEAIWIGLSRANERVGPLWVTGAPVDPGLRSALPTGLGGRNRECLALGGPRPQVG